VLSRRARLPFAIALVFGTPLSPPAMAQTTASVVAIMLTSSWSSPSPDPMGLAYQASTGRLIVSDSEVEETKVFAGTNVWLRTTSGKPRGKFDTTSYSIEPTDVAARSGGRVMFFVDDNQDRVFRIRVGHDGRWGTDDDKIFSFSTRPFGSRDPEGLGFGDGSLFITDGINTQVYRLDSGANERFDGIAPGGDDTVTSFDTAALGMDDPEDVAYDAATARLYLASRADRAIAVSTTFGDLIEVIDLSASGILYPSGIALAPGSSTAATHIFVADRGVDNNPEQGGDPNENDGRIFEFALSAPPPDSVPPAIPGIITIQQSTVGLPD
jgi:DNA-binding beta-propeller fold protein YncE